MSGVRSGERIGWKSGGDRNLLTRRPICRMEALQTAGGGVAEVAKRIRACRRSGVEV